MVHTVQVLILSLIYLFVKKLIIVAWIGAVFAYKMGRVVMVHVSEAEVVREICLCVSLELGKGTYLKKTHEPLFGQGILKSNGLAWAHQRKLIAPQFFHDKVKVSPFIIFFSYFFTLSFQTKKQIKIFKVLF